MEPGRRPIGGHHRQIRQPPGVGRQQQQIPVVGHRSVGTYILCGWVQCQGCGSGSGPFWLEPDSDPIGTYFGNVKLYKQGQNILI